MVNGLPKSARGALMLMVGVGVGIVLLKAVGSAFPKSQSLPVVGKAFQ